MNVTEVEIGDRGVRVSDVEKEVIYRLGQHDTDEGELFPRNEGLLLVQDIISEVLDDWGVPHCHGRELLEEILENLIWNKGQYYGGS